MSRVPVTVLTGFLGAGKTTLVNRLLKERPGTRFGLVVNEFGEAALESQLVESRGRPLYELPSGCLCCVSPGDLLGALQALRARDPRIAHVLVEASGLSSPGPLLGALTGTNGYQLGGVFCVVDPLSFVSHIEDFPAVRRQLSFADAVLLTKTDLAPAEAVAATRERLGALRPGVKVLDTAERLPWSVLFESRTDAIGDDTPVSEPKRRFFQGGRHHDAEVLEFEAGALAPEPLARVFADLPPGVLRAKGVLHLALPGGARYKYLVQYTGGQRQLYSRPWSRGEAHRTSLVFLGSDFDSAALRSALEACRAAGP